MIERYRKLKVYKYTFEVSLLISILSFIFSLIFCSSNTNIGKWFENILIGIFASGLLLVGSALIGYLVEERKICIEYYWKLLSLKSKVLVLSTIPIEKNTSEEYYDAIEQINELLLGYFALVDHDFIFWRWRGKIQKLLEIHAFLFEYKNLAESAEIHFREYIARTKNESGIRNYPKEKFLEDIRSFSRAADNFKDSGHPFVVYLDLKIQEYHTFILK